jgi:methionyl-tRNA synthetase
MEETNWFFKLSAFKERLAAHFDAHPDWIQPRSRFNEARALIDQLDDLSISRGSITWGVDVPWDDTQVLYVWIDALFNYASALTFAADEDLTSTYWPPTVQLLAKDILKFHAIYWPAFLMSVGMELPKQLVIHGYLTVGGDKMGKSMGNALDPLPIIEQHGADPLRWYLIRAVQFGQDGAVSKEDFDRRYDGELANDLGNLVSRTSAMIGKYLGGVDAVVPPTSADHELAARAAATLQTYEQCMEQVDLSGALAAVWEYVRELNRYVETQAPWVLARDDARRDELLATLGGLAEGLVAVAYMLAPLMPDTSVRIMAAFGREHGSVEQWQWGRAAGGVVTKPDALFPRIEQHVGSSA